jgi:hypothetical protein
LFLADEFKTTDAVTQALEFCANAKEAHPNDEDLFAATIKGEGVLVVLGLSFALLD